MDNSVYDSLDNDRINPKIIIHNGYMQITYFTNNRSIKISESKPIRKETHGTICLSRKTAEKKDCKNLIKILQTFSNEPIEQPNGSYIELKNYSDYLYINNEIIKEMQTELDNNKYEWICKNLWIYNYIDDIKMTALVPLNVKIHNIVLKYQKEYFDLSMSDENHDRLDILIEKLEYIEEDINKMNITDIDVPVLMNTYYDIINSLNNIIRDAKLDETQYCEYE